MNRMFRIFGRPDHSSRSVALTLMASLLFGGIVSAAPQSGSRGQGYASANEITEFEGKLTGVRGNIMTVTREDGTECFVMFPDETDKLVFVAPALPAYLRRGMPIRFATTLGPTGMPLTPVDTIEIISPVDLNSISNQQKMKYIPGVNSTSKERRPKNAPLTGKVYVVGSLVMLTPDGGLAVQAGTTPVQTRVAPNLQIEIRANNLSLAQPGDSVKVSGFYQPPDDTKVKAAQVTVTADRVFGEAPPPKERRTRKSRKDTKAEIEKEKALKKAK